MTICMKMAALFLTLTIAQTAVIYPGYAEDNNEEVKKQSSETQKSDGSIGAKTFTQSPLLTFNTTHQPNGATQYTQHCSVCHDTFIKGSSVDSIEAAINFVPAMSSLRSLTASQIADIAAEQ